MPTVICPICQRPFYSEPYRLLAVATRYCSLSCRNVGYKTTPETFWSRVDWCQHELWCLYCCAPWQGAHTQTGYGEVMLERQVWLAHRLAWVLYHGRMLPDGKVCRHLCHNRLCCNVMHLTLGSPQDNSDDSVRARRMASGSRNGGGKKLLEHDLPQIFSWYAEGVSAAKIAAHFGVSDTLIYKIIHGKLWRHHTRHLLPKTKES